MGKQRSWTDEDLVLAVQESFSYRSVLIKLGLIPAGGNYVQVRYRVITLGISTEHFTGARWNKGKTYHTSTRPQLSELLIKDSRIQSYKLKKRLYENGLKQEECEICGWAQIAEDGRIPLELDHINGDHFDNRLVNLRILCPNCHSLQPTHRGKNKKVSLRKFTN